MDFVYLLCHEDPHIYSTSALALDFCFRIIKGGSARSDTEKEQRRVLIMGSQSSKLTTRLFPVYRNTREKQLMVISFVHNALCCAQVIDLKAG